MSKIYIGISGWRYAPWRGVFYPKGLAQKRELEFASRTLATCEINGSFYALQRPASYAAWYEHTPAGFVFSVKANRLLTHVLRLRDIEKPLADMFASGMFNLREKLGPVLWQFPPSLEYDSSLFERFLALLPQDLDSALQLIRRHHETPILGAYPETSSNHRIRHAVEIRHPSFATSSFIALLRKHGVALVVSDSGSRWPYLEDVTADFMYVRLHGEQELYASGYSDEALDRWASRIRAWHAGVEPQDARLVCQTAELVATGRDVYCYLDNTMKARAPFDARYLIDRLSLDAGLIPFSGQGEIFQAADQS
ncbi:MAG TPA: DUF72 domain-containing protein [Noviherbaspirillum sp.]